MTSLIITPFRTLTSIASCIASASALFKSSLVIDWSCACLYLFKYISYSGFDSGLNIRPNYDELGFAVVLITNHQNPILKKLINNFAQDFRYKYKNELTEIQDLNKLINVSEFNETKSIIERNFHMYLA